MAHHLRQIKVSIIVPLYNSSAFVCPTLDSIVAQTYSNWEAILVDDGSTDDTREVIEPYLRDERFRYFRQPNQGIAGARNAGIHAATGDWICLLDHDDRWLPQKLERQLEFVLKGHYQIACTDAFIVEENDRWRYSRIFIEDVIRIGAGDKTVDVWGAIINQNFICTCSLMMERSLLETSDLLDPRAVPADDYDMWLRLAPHARLGFLNEPLVEYYRHEQNYSNDECHMLEQIIYVLRKNRRTTLADTLRVRQFDEAIGVQYEILLGKLLDSRRYLRLAKHICSLLFSGRSGIQLLRRTFRQPPKATRPLLNRAKDSIRYRLRRIL